MEIAASTGDSKDERGLEGKILTDCAAICFDSIILPVIESQVTDPNPVPGANPDTDKPVYGRRPRGSKVHPSIFFDWGYEPHLASVCRSIYLMQVQSALNNTHQIRDANDLLGNWRFSRIVHNFTIQTIRCDHLMHNRQASRCFSRPFNAASVRHSILYTYFHNKAIKLML